MSELSHGDTSVDTVEKKKADDAPNIIAKPADLQIISGMKKDIKRVRDSRLEYERQWLVNIAFLFGKQHFNLQRKPMATTEERIVWELTDIERKKKTLRSSNYILPLFRSLLARMLQMKATITVDATTGAERDKSAARVRQEVGRDFWANCNKNNPQLCQDLGGMGLVQKKLFTFLLAVGNGYTIPYFNEQTQAKAFLDGRIIPSMQIGEAEIKVYNPFDYFRDRGGRFIIVKEMMDPDWIENQWNAKVDPDKMDMDDIEQQLLYILQNGSGQWDDDRAMVLSKWCLPNKEYPNGEYVVASSKQILYKGELPSEYKGRLPGTEYKFVDLMFGPYGQGIIEQLVNLQEEYNFTLSRIAGYKKWMTGKIMIPRNSKLSTKWNDELGQMVFYNQGGKPTYEAGASAPDFLFKDLMRIRKDMEDIASIHDASIGREPDQVKSGIGIENLSELDNSQLSPDLMTIEQKHAYVMEQVFDIMEDRYSVPHFMALTSDNIPAEVMSIKGSQIAGNCKTDVSLGSSLPASKTARQAYIANMLKMGLIDPIKAKELSEFGDIEGIYTNLDEQAAKQENQIMLKPDYVVVAEPWEDHPIHLKILHDFMKTPAFYALDDQTRQKYLDHEAEHQTYMIHESQAIPGGPAPGPGGPGPGPGGSGGSPMPMPAGPPMPGPGGLR